MSEIRALIVDDHALFRRGMVELLANEADIAVAGEADSGPEAVQKAEELAPDVVLMDLNMPGESGIEATARLVQCWPTIKVLVVTVSEDPSDVVRALSVGAHGYIVKTAQPAEIVDALRQVARGWVVISPAVASTFLADLGQPPEGADAGAASAVDATVLTDREREILQLVARGLRNVDIADELVLSENTVKTHIKNILSKLQVKNRHEAAAYAARLGSA